MLGWELPPHLSGGLGTACQGLVGGLARRGVDVTFVLPRARGGEELPSARLVALDDGAVRAGAVRDGAVRAVPVASALRPYLTAAEYARQVGLGVGGAEAREGCGAGTGASDRRPECVGDGGPASDDAGALDDAGVFDDAGALDDRGRDGFEGGYGPTLFAEVARYARRVAGIAAAEDERPALVHAHDWMTWPAGVAARERLDRPLVCHVHACEADRSGEHGDPRIEAVEAAALAAADRVVCVSRYTAERVTARYALDPARTRVVHNGVERPAGTARRRRERGAPPLVLFLGRVTAQKGPEVFLAAAERIARALPEVRFLVAGDGDRWRSMVEGAAERGLARRIAFTGFLDRAGVERAYAAADVYVMPSVSEPFGLAPLEALARGVPVVVSSASGVAEALPSALRVAPGDAAGLARCVTALLARPALARALVRCGRRELEGLTWDAAGAALEAVYAEIRTVPDTLLSPPDRRVPHTPPSPTPGPVPHTPVAVGRGGRGA